MRQPNHCRQCQAEVSRYRTYCPPCSDARRVQLKQARRLRYKAINARLREQARLPA